MGSRRSPPAPPNPADPDAPAGRQQRLQSVVATARAPLQKAGYRKPEFLQCCFVPRCSACPREVGTMCDDAAGFIAVEPVREPESCPADDSTSLLLFAGKMGGGGPAASSLLDTISAAPGSKPSGSRRTVGVGSPARAGPARPGFFPHPEPPQRLWRCGGLTHYTRDHRGPGSIAVREGKTRASPSCSFPGPRSPATSPGEPRRSPPAPHDLLAPASCAGADRGRDLLLLIPPRRRSPRRRGAGCRTGIRHPSTGGFGVRVWRISRPRVRASS